MQNIIEVKGLRKNFGSFTAVNGISFAVKKGSFFSFLGQNGAGKTTTINMLIGLLGRSGGEILYNESPDFEAFKNQIGVVFQNNTSDDMMSVGENLAVYSTLYNKTNEKSKARIKEVIALLSLGEILKQRFKTLSGGQKRKVEIARALLMNPQILFLDEPTTGLDPRTRAEIWAIIRKLKEQKGMTVFLTTHYMEETAAADSIAIINKGEIIATGTPAELKSRYAFDKLLITPKNCESLEKQLAISSTEWQRTADTYAVRIKDTADSIELIYKLKDNIRFYEVIKGSMDDVFLSVVGEKIDGGEVL